MNTIVACFQNKQYRTAVFELPVNIIESVRGVITFVGSYCFLGYWRLPTVVWFVLTISQRVVIMNNSNSSGSLLHDCS